MFSFKVIAPQFKHFQKLRDFIEMKLPPGFPVKVDIPVLPTVSARVTFHDFSWKNIEERNDTTSETNGKIVDSNKNGAFGKETKTKKDAKSKKDKDKQEEAASSSKTKKDKKDKSKKESSQKGEKGADEDTVEEEDTLSEDSEDSPYLDDSLFQIPAGYVEDNTRFPDL